MTENGSFERIMLRVAAFGGIFYPLVSLKGHAVKFTARLVWHRN